MHTSTNARNEIIILRLPIIMMTSLNTAALMLYSTAYSIYNAHTIDILYSEFIGTMSALPKKGICEHNMMITDLATTDSLNARIDFDARGRSNADVTRSILNEWRGSQTLADMADADDYFRVRNINIQAKSRHYTDADGVRQQNNSLSNAKIAASFLRSNVLQKVNYAVSRPFILNVESPSRDDADPLRQAYLNEWQAFITPTLRTTLRRIVTDAVNKGIGWAFVTIIDGKLQIFDINPCQVYPAWTDMAHSSLDAVVRDYTVTAYLNNQPQILRKVEFWDADSVDRYSDSNGQLLPDYDELDSHLRLGDIGISWERVPFVALKGNDDELPALNIIRQQIDAYDALQSKAVDALQDDIDAVLLLKNVSPEIGSLADARRIIQNARVVSVDADGDARYLNSTPNISAMLQMLQLLKDDIREFGHAVDTHDLRWSSNPSGVALKAIYQDLDTYTNGLETELNAFFHNLKPFFDLFLQFKGLGNASVWADYALSVTLDRDMMLNSFNDIQETVMLKSIGVSQATVDDWNPAVSSHDSEQARRAREANAT